MKQVTLKEDENLLEWLKIIQKEKNEFADHVLTKAIEVGVMSDSFVFCGHKLFDMFDEEGYNITQATLFCTGKATAETQEYFSKLIVWGIENKCPECGCKLLLEDANWREEQGDRSSPPEVTMLWEEWQCINPECMYTDTIDYEPDPDRNRD